MDRRPGLYLFRTPQTTPISAESRRVWLISFLTLLMVIAIGVIAVYL